MHSDDRDKPQKQIIAFAQSQIKLQEDKKTLVHTIENQEIDDTLPETEPSEEQKQLYLTGCILSYYQQKKLYSDKQASIAEYLLADPLWIFVGGK